jgi:calcium-dependent protein kinase
MNINMEEEAINYTSFLAMTLESKFYLTKERLWAAFKFFDVDN